MTRLATCTTFGRKLGTTAILIGSMLLSFAARGQTSNAPGTPQITSVGSISPRAWQTIVIKGAHFGTNPPINGCPEHLRVTDVTTNWSVPAVGPFGGCQAGIFVSSWNDTEIVIEGFPSFQRGQDAFKIGDVIKIEVSNAQQGGPAAWQSMRVSPGETRAPASTASVPVSTQSSQPDAPETTQITSVGSISPKAWQTIVITGAHFGTNPPINGCPEHLRVTDVTTNWSVPAVGPFGGCQAGIFVSSWNDTEIVIEGFPSFQRGQDAFKIGDVIKIEVSNAQQGGPTAWHSLRVTPEGIRLSPPSPQVPVSTQSSQPSAAVTIPAGTSILIRMIDSVDSSKSKIGTVFHASLEGAVVVGSTVVAPKGADVYGKIAQAKSAGKISGGAELTLEMTGIRINSNIVPVESTHYNEMSKGRGKQSAERIGGGAAVGATIGAILGRGKGAAIGAGAGAAAGTAAQLATHGKQLRIPSETVLEFELQQPITVPAVGASVGTNEGASPPVEVGSSSAPMATGSTDDMASPSAEKTSSVEMGSSSAPVASSSNGDKVSPSVQTAAYDENATAYVVTSSNEFGKMDLTTGKYTQIGHMDGLPKSLGGLGTVDGKLYGGAIRTGNLYKVDASNGTLTLVGTGKLSYFVTGSTTNALYAVGQDLSLYSIDAKSGVATLIGPTGFNPANVGGGALSSGSEMLYMSAGANLSRGATLYSLNTSTGAATAIGSLGSGTGAPPMVFERETLYAALNFPSKKICRLNTTTGVLTCFASTSGVPGYTYGLASASSLSTKQVASDSLPPTTGTSIVQAVILGGATALELPQAKMYLYGMTTGGAAPSSGFTDGPYAQVVNAAGNLSVALAYGTRRQNSYTSQTAYHDIGGVSVAGSWSDFKAYYGSNRQSGAHDASVSFQANEDSLVVVFGLASSQQSVTVEGVPQLQVDASEGAMVIAHAYLKPGSYTVVEHSKVLSAGQGPANMADLVGVFVFTSGQVRNEPTVASGQTPGVSIRNVDFLNLDYPSDCWEQFDGFGKVIHVSNGQWTKEEVGGFSVGNQASEWMVSYGDLKGDGQDEAVIVTSCQGQVNFDYEEVFVFRMSPGGPKLLARLSPSDWGPGTRINEVHIAKQQLIVQFLTGGAHCCPDSAVTVRFHWNGSRFVRIGSDRKPYKGP